MLSKTLISTLMNRQYSEWIKYSEWIIKRDSVNIIIVRLEYQKG